MSAVHGNTKITRVGPDFREEVHTQFTFSANHAVSNEIVRGVFLDEPFFRMTHQNVNAHVTNLVLVSQSEDLLVREHVHSNPSEIW